MSLDFAPDDVRAIAIACLGDPTPGVGKPHELRFGSHGSMSVDLQKAVFTSHEEGKGGGILELIERTRSLKGKDAIAFIRSLGIEVSDRDGYRAPAPDEQPKARIVKTYDYKDENGDLLFQVCRMEPKSFRQRRPDPTDRSGWSWSVKGVRPVPYRLDVLREAIADGIAVMIVEGEKDADALIALGIAATTNAAGAGKWPEALSDYFNGARVVILPDNDEPGNKHALLVANRLHGIARSIKILELPGLPAKGDVSDWLAAGGTPDDLYNLAAQQPTWQRQADEPWEGPSEFPEPDQQREWRSRFGAVPLGDINAPGPEYEHLIKGVLTRGEVSMLVGPSGSGKSFLATDASLAIARGVDWLAPQGKPAPRVRRGGVMYIAGEGARGLKKRLRAYLQYHGIDGKDVPFVLLTLPVDLHGSDEPTNWLIEEGRHHGEAFMAAHGVPLELVVIDTLSASTPGANENASDDVSRVLGRCHRLAHEANCAVMLVHHMRADGVRERGHSSLRANVDSVIEVVKTESRDAVGTYGRIIRTAKITKQKDGEDGLTFRFVLPAVELGQDADGDPITSCIVAPPDMGEYDEAIVGEPDKGAKLSDQAKVFLRAIDAALDEYGHEPPAMMRLPKAMRVVPWKHVREAFQKITTEGQDESDPEKKKAALRQSLKRHGDQFLARKIIGRDNDFGVVWRTGRQAAGEKQDTSGDNVLPFQKPGDDAVPDDLLM